MRRLMIVALALVAVPVSVSATESTPRNASPISVVERVAAVPFVEQVQVPVRAERQDVEAAAEMALQPTRMTWWWLVGAIVVAGIIIAAVT